MRMQRSSIFRQVAKAVIGGLFILAANVPVAIATDWASVVMYHRFDEPQHPATNIKPEQFREHIAELKSGKYTVLPLSEIVDRLEQGEDLPDRTVAITIDDAFRSVYDVAWPMLREAGLPFTVFISTEPVDKGYPDFMSWDQIRALRDAGVHIGHHSHRHMALTAMSPTKAASEIEMGSKRFEAELGFVPAIFAYPYGSYGDAVKAVIRQAGFKAAFGQQSGIAYSGYGRFELPRFVMSEKYGGIGRFRLAVNALPFRVKDVTPSDNVLTRNPPIFGFTIDADYGNLKSLSCFSSSQTGGAVPIEKIGESRIEVRVSTPFKASRGRINCTLLGPKGRWRWFGSLFYIPKGVGR